MDVEDVIAALSLKPLPEEGGYFRETHRSIGRIKPGVLSATAESRSFFSAILYLITPDTFSALHRLQHEEVFHFYLGDPVRQVQITPDGQVHDTVLGQNILEGQKVQSLVQAHRWQGARLAPGGKWALLGTTMAPGFDWNDFELGIRAQLISRYPDHEELIKQFTRNSPEP